MNYDDHVKITPVYFNRGVFYSLDDKHPLKRRKYARAPFDIVQMERAEGKPSEIYIRPRLSCFMEANTLGTRNTGHEEEGIGYLTGEHYLLDEYKMGAFNPGESGIFDCWEMYHLRS